jgi:hypothetical protein
MCGGMGRWVAVRASGNWGNEEIAEERLDAARRHKNLGFHAAIPPSYVPTRGEAHMHRYAGTWVDSAALD